MCWRGLDRACALPVRADLVASAQKQLPSTRTEIGAGGELIDIENSWDALGVVNTVADPDYVTASASRERAPNSPKSIETPPLWR